MSTENKLTVNHDLFISIGLKVPVNPETFRKEIDTLLFENIGYMQSWGVHTSHEFLTLCNNLIKERNELRKALEYIADRDNCFENLPDYAKKALGKEQPNDTI